MKDNHSYREHCEAAARYGNPVAKAELQGPELPASLTYLWGWFLELHETRSGNGFGPNPFTYAEIDAWARLTGRALAPWEVGGLRALDRAWLVEPKLEE